MLVFKKGVSVTDNFDKLFPMLDIESVEISSAGGYSNRGVLRRERILINLTHKTRKSVLEAVEILKDNKYVYDVSPNYLLRIPEDPRTNIFIFGDVNSAGSVGNDDLILAARSVVNTIDFNSVEFTAADMIEDEFVDNQDIILLAKTVVGVID